MTLEVMAVGRTLKTQSFVELKKKSKEKKKERKKESWDLNKAVIIPLQIRARSLLWNK